MRCTKCGSYVEKGQITCPMCGTVVDVSENVEKIQSEIGSKIDMFLNDKVENLRDVKDGVEIEDGRMDVSQDARLSDTMNLSSDFNDTVFSSASVEARQRETIQTQVSREEKIREERLREELLKEERLRQERLAEERIKRERAMQREAYAESRKKPRDAGRAEKNGKTGIIIAIIAAIVVAAVIVILLVTGLKEEKQEAETTTGATTEAILDVIVCNVNDGTEVAVPIEVTLESREGNRIYYTLDGKTPSISSNKYVEPIKFDASHVTGEGTGYTLRAVTYTQSSQKAAELKISFTLINPTVNAPTIQPASGNYASSQEITVVADEGATIYYTYDGTVPTASSATYSGPVTMMRGNNIFSAVAEKNGTFSSVSQAVFNLDIPAAITYQEAADALKTFLRDEKGINVDEKSPSGETAKISSEGTGIIDNRQFYLISCDIFDSAGKLTAGTLFGVDDQNRDIRYVKKDGLGYAFAD